MHGDDARERQHANQVKADDLDTLRVRLGDLFLQLRALTAGAAPILIDLAARTGIDLRLAPESCQVTSTTAFPVPTLESV